MPFRRLALLATLLWSPAVLAQVEPGDRTPVAGGLAPAARATVYWCGVGERAARARAEAPCGRALQARYGSHGVRFVALVDAPAVAGMPGGFELAVDAGAAARTWWRPDDPAFVLVVDAAGVVRFVGEPYAGLADALEAVLAGRDDVAAARATRAVRLRYGRSLFDLRQPAVAPLHAAIAQAPRDGVLRGLLYLVAAVGCRDASLADRVADEAAAALADEPRALAAFLDLAARGAIRKGDFALRMVARARQAAAAAADDVAVQLAALRVLLHGGDGRNAGRIAAIVGQRARGDADACLELACILAEAPAPAVHADLAASALAGAAAREVAPGRLAAVRFAVLQRCAGDADAAARALTDHLAQRGSQVSSNNECWRLLTDLRTVGRHTAFAAALADHMAHQDDGLDYFECDTAGFAMFVAGRDDEAIAYAEQAVARAGAAGVDYADRLRWYREARPPAPR